MTYLGSEPARPLAGTGLRLDERGGLRRNGIQTFRESERPYRGLDPYTHASLECFFKDPAMVRNWYLMRVRAVWDAPLNAAHRALVGLASKEAELTLLTSNVDPLYERAGSKNFHRPHGDFVQTNSPAAGESRR